MKRIFIVLILLSLISAILFSLLKENNVNQSLLGDLQKQYPKEQVPSADHLSFAVLKGEFESPQDVTRACLSCHTNRGREMMNSAHWNWSKEQFIEGRGVVELGKKNGLNNFCIGVGGNEQSCARCHAGYGWKDKTFDLSDQDNIDCLICHDNTGDYMKKYQAAGLPDDSVDLNNVARHVGLPGRFNCGSCHFFGGGGNNIKHGDLEQAQIDCTADLDVHMASEGADMNCVDCHSTEKHSMSGKLYSVSSMNRDRKFCSDCHSKNPHKNKLMDEHTVKVACQTCHIPTYAKGAATKTSWDWSTAGRLKDGEPFSVEDEEGNHTYLSIKGDFVWGKNLEPEYAWFNGTADHYFIGDDVDTASIIQINTLNGSYKDRDAKIIPVKIHRAKQIFDCQLKQIILPKLFANGKGEGGYWEDFDWDMAAKLGMENIHQAYSGDYCFIKTEMSWPLNHMVAKTENTLDCKECHSRNGRLAGLDDFYMPGRDYNASLESMGWLLILLTIVGILIHSSIRIISFYKTNKTKANESN
jgi:octaheme c-type cytochrome (tetrathionate reductase family)